MKTAMRFLKNNKLTLILILVFIVMYILHITVPNYRISKLFASGGIKKIDHEYYRYLTYAFLHASIIHLLGNVFGILCVGFLIENKIGSTKFFIYFFIGAIFSEVIFSGIIYQNSNIGGVGASGGIFTLIGIFIIYCLYNKALFKNKTCLVVILMMIIYMVVASLSIEALASHALGLTCGLIIGYLSFHRAK